VHIICCGSDSACFEMSKLLGKGNKKKGMGVRENHSKEKFVALTRPPPQWTEAFEKYHGVPQSSKLATERHPQELNMETFQRLNSPKTVTARIETARKERFYENVPWVLKGPIRAGIAGPFQKHLIMNASSSSSPFPRLIKPMAPPYPLPIVEGSMLSCEVKSSAPSVDPVPKVNSEDTLVMKVKRIDADKLDYERKHMPLLDRKDARLKISVTPKPAKGVTWKETHPVPVAQQAHEWSNKLRSYDGDRDRKKEEPKDKGLVTRGRMPVKIVPYEGRMNHGKREVIVSPRHDRGFEMMGMARAYGKYVDPLNPNKLSKYGRKLYEGVKRRAGIKKPDVLDFYDDDEDDDDDDEGRLGLLRSNTAEIAAALDPKPIYFYMRKEEPTLPNRTVQKAEKEIKKIHHKTTKEVFETERKFPANPIRTKFYVRDGIPVPLATHMPNGNTFTKPSSVL
jgi:hypothetical protein